MEDLGEVKHVLAFARFGAEVVGIGHLEAALLVPERVLLNIKYGVYTCLHVHTEWEGRKSIFRMSAFLLNVQCCPELEERGCWRRPRMRPQAT